ncbi:MAG: hypothetical protein AAFV53_37435 [Myxococcota bacterium]
MEIQVNYSDLYGSFSSMTIVDHRLAGPALLARVQLEAAALSSMREDAGVEPWARVLFLTELGRRGATLYGPPTAPMLSDARPTLSLRDLYLGTGTSPLDVIVKEQGDRVGLGLRSFSEEASLCPQDFALDIPYFALHGTAQRTEDGALVATWHEVAIPQVDPERTLRTLSTPAAQLCDTIAAVYSADDTLRPSGTEYEAAATALIGRVLRPFIGEE